jgi:hypothetical protein
MAIWRGRRSVALILVVLVGSSVLAPGHLPAAKASGASVVAGLGPTATTASSTPAISPTVTASPTVPIATPAVVTLRPGCDVKGDVLPAANRLLHNRYKLGSRPVVVLPRNPSWREDPFRDDNWLFNYHSLRFVLKLEAAWARTGRRVYLDRALFLLRDWLADNPRSHPRSPLAWERHATAWRAMVYACTAEIVPMTPWLKRALILHGGVLADRAFYEVHGNHALNQAIGLLEVGCFLHRSDWLDLAARRINTLVVESVDSQGATNEQAIGYQFYNYERYRVAALRLRACGRPVSSLFSRIDLMPEFLGWATLPDRHYEQIGDTDARSAHSIPGTLAEFAATGGTSGPHPTDVFKTYRAGYAFGRSGWGDDRPFADETAFSVHYGPPVRFHGHADGSALTVYGYGSRLIVGSGKFSYDESVFRRYFVGRSAQNVVTVGGLPYRTTGATPLRFRIETAQAYGVSVKVGGYPGVSDTRTVIYSRTGGYLVVDDRLRSARSRTYTQLWHLAAGTHPARTGRTVRTHSPGGDVVISQLLGRPSISIVVGARSPVQGWRTIAYNKKTAAPAVLARRSGQSVRFLTLIVPVPDASVVVRVVSVRTLADGFSLVVSVGGRTERMVVSGAAVSIVPLA